jgi:hypothetical protein
LHNTALSIGIQIKPGSIRIICALRMMPPGVIKIHIFWRDRELHFSVLNEIANEIMFGWSKRSKPDRVFNHD